MNKIYLYTFLFAYLLAGLPLFELYCTLNHVDPFLVQAWFKIVKILGGIAGIICIPLGALLLCLRFGTDESTLNARRELYVDCGIKTSLWGLLIIPLWLIMFFSIQWDDVGNGLSTLAYALCFTIFQSSVNLAKRDYIIEMAKRGTEN